MIRRPAAPSERPGLPKPRHIGFRHRAAGCYEGQNSSPGHDQSHAMIEAVVEAGAVVAALALLLYFQVLRPGGANRADPPTDPPEQPTDK